MTASRSVIHAVVIPQGHPRSGHPERSSRSVSTSLLNKLYKCIQLPNNLITLRFQTMLFNIGNDSVMLEFLYPEVCFFRFS